MKISEIKFSLLCFVVLLLSCTQKPKDTVERIDEVETLIKQMTLEEKVGQMTQVTLDVITNGQDIFSSFEPVILNEDSLRKAILDYHVGSFLNTANNRARTTTKWNEIINTFQNIATNETRLKIPIIYGIDAIHGASYTAGATMFPQAIAQAATWNRDLVKQAAQITAYEVRASSIHWNFSPVLDLGIDPRWPRHWETFGEDPYLCAEMGVEVVKGYQGDNNELTESTRIAACIKHFLGYSAAESGKDRTPADIPELNLREYHLTAFKKAIDAGASTIMINSGIINGVPVHANADIITNLLKKELGFNGFVITDWADIENLYKRDKVASTYKEAIKTAINAGIDMSMVPYDYVSFCTLLTELVNEGEVPMERINDAVRRILNIKYQLGLFSTQPNDKNHYPKFGSDEFEQTAYNTASEAITLLKNKHQILPLNLGTKILVSGPNGNNMRTLNGGWTYSWQGEKTHEFAQRYQSFFHAIKREFGSNNVKYVAGVEYKMNGKYWEEENLNIEAAVEAAKDVDVIVLCLGENTYTEKPGDLNDLRISENQSHLAQALHKTGKPIVLVLNEGRPRIIEPFVQHMDAILQTYLSGNYSGVALANILSGDVNPSGKLPYTYPRFANSINVYNHKNSEESLLADGHYDMSGGFYPQYEFGFGLSYTTFDYSDLRIDKLSFNPSDTIKVAVNVKNTGKLAGKETVQLYSCDQYASITPDVKRLRRFDKIMLNPGEEKEVIFKLTAKDLAFANGDGNRIAEAGDFDLMIQHLKKTITLKKSITY